MKCAAIIVAAGSGERAGNSGTPKQMVMLMGRPMLAFSVAAFSAHVGICETIIVCPPGEETAYEKRVPGASAYVAGGATRSQSVRAGLAAVSDESITHIMVHDAARPGLSGAMIDALLEALVSNDAAAPALPVADALKRQTDTGLRTTDRDGLWRVQTPQAFRRAALERALASEAGNFVDDLKAVEGLGVSPKLIQGTRRLSKVTYPEDFAIMAQILGSGTAIRVGTGFDVHAFAEGDAVMLCGVEIAHDRTLAGHSDADVGWHALTDAILGALALGDIGDHFPPDDPQWRGADSEVFLRHAARLATERGYSISNCDVTLICERPKIKPARAAMRARTAEVLGVDTDCVSVKATTTEQLGFTGRGEGIAAQAVVSLSATP